MRIEVEQKFRVAAFDEIERQLTSLNAGARQTSQQADQYFNHPSRDFARSDEALRLRRVGERNWITYKGKKLDATTKSRREIEIELSRGDDAARQAADMFVALGFVNVAQVHKRRTVIHLDWQQRPVEVALDTVAEIGNFVELKIIADEDELSAARETLASLATRLGLADSERRSYLQLLLDARA